MVRVTEGMNRGWFGLYGVLLALLVLVAGVPAANGAEGTWRPAGSLATQRHQHTATLLPNGTVLVAGGYNSVWPFAQPSAELFNPATNGWRSAGSLANERRHHTATLLPNGKVLAVGGSNNNTALASTELYDPATDRWSAAAPLTAMRSLHTATLLANGKLLVVGGIGTGDLASAELYDPSTNSWSAAGSMSNARRNHTATLLPNGKVLIVGGIEGSTMPASAELYDPVTNSWSAAGALTTARIGHSATLLPNGTVLVAGGYINMGDRFLASTELYDPATNSWSAGGDLAAARASHTATLLPNGVLQVAGGHSYATYAIAGAEQYDSATNRWGSAGSLTTGRFEHTATLLPDGGVLTVGGEYQPGNGGELASAELYRQTASSWSAPVALPNGSGTTTATLLPNGTVLLAGGGYTAATGAQLLTPAPTLGWSPAGAMIASRTSFTATLLPSGKVLVAGGLDGNDSALATAELYDPATDSWSAAGTMTNARKHAAATLLANGKVLVVGGLQDGSYGYLASADLYDPATNSWSAAGSMSTGRVEHSLTLLPGGKVLVMGGSFHDGSEFSILNSAELYDPATNSWSAAAPAISAHAAHTATVLPNGKVLVTGGARYSGGYFFTLDQAELYDPAGNSWSPAAPLATARMRHAATLLPNGTVLVTGGEDGTNPITSVEVYDPATNSWLAAGTLFSRRADHTALLLADGRALVIAGYGTTDCSNCQNNTLEIYTPETGFSDSRRPTISGIVNTGGKLHLTGSGFRGDSEGAGGSSAASATNHPMVQLQRLGSEQQAFVLTDPTAFWSAGSIEIAAFALAELSNGPYLATVYGGGVPSVASFLTIALDPEIAITPNQLDFAAVDLGAGATRTVTVTNSGARALTFSAVAFGGADGALFARSGGGTCGATLAAGASCTLELTFAPTTTGTKTALLSLYTNNPTPLTVPVTGQGVYPNYLLTVTLNGTGSGTVNGSTSGTPPTLSFPTSGSQSLVSGTSVTLSAAPTVGSQFAGWGGDCTGLGTCVISLTGPRDVTATFIPDTTAPVTTATPAGGSYTTAQQVVLTSNEAATIHYTVDGSSPTTAAPVYAGPITISAATTLRYFARDLAGNSEAVQTQTYTITGIPEQGMYAWASRAALPTGLSRAVSAVVDGTIYIYGGVPATAAVLRYTPLSDSWSSGNPLPLALYGGAATAQGTTVYIVGGFDSLGTPQSNVIAYNTLDGTSTIIGSLILPRARMNAAYLNNKLYVVGGTGAETTLEEFDLVTRTSRIAGTLPEPTQLAGVAAYQDKIIIAAGGSDNTKTWSFDPATELFTSLASLPSTAEGRNLIVDADRLYLVDGWGYGGVNTVYEYSMYGNVWSSVTSVPTLRNVPMVEAVNGILYVMGGDTTGTANEAWRFGGGWYVNSVNPSQPEVIDWQAVQHAPLAAGSYVKIANVYYYVHGSSGPGTWSGAGYTAAMLYTCVQTTGEAIGPANLTALVGQPITAYATWPVTGSTDVWTATGAMATIRGGGQSATTLSNGKVLVVGGYNDSGYLSGAELYDPVSRSWSSAGAMQAARGWHTATLLANGKVLVAGGSNSAVLASAELYDPVTNSWSTTMGMAEARSFHSATLLTNGKVLIAGGRGENTTTLASVEIFDPDANSWSAGGSLAEAREYHAVTLLPDGQVFVIGGQGNNNSHLSSCERYNPATNSWTQAGALAEARTRHTATLLANGKVLVAGGYGNIPFYPNFYAAATLYDPATNSWSPAGTLNELRGSHTATLLQNGKVLVAGGNNFGKSFIDSAELYDPDTNSWSGTSPLIEARYGHAAVLLPSGRVLAAGGWGSSNGYLGSAELYGPTNTTPPVATATPAGGTYAASQTVALTADAPATIHYTTDGSEPTTSSPTSTGTLAITSSMTLKFFATNPAGGNGPVQTETYLINGVPIWQIHDVKPLEPSWIDWDVTGHGTVADGEYVRVNGTVYYVYQNDAGSWNGSGYASARLQQCDQATKQPMTFSTPCGEQCYDDGTGTGTMTCTFILCPSPLFADMTATTGMTIGSGFFPVTTVNPGGGSYPAPQTVTLATNGPATIYYTLDGSVPTAASSVYSGPITIPGSMTLNVFARDAAGNNEAVQTHTYTITGVPDQGLFTWSTKAPLPYGISRAVSATVNGKIYILGGSPPTASVVRYDPAANSWESVPPLPLALFGAASAVQGTTVYVIGGIDGQGNYLNSVFAYNTLDGSTIVLGSLLHPRARMNATFLNNKLYVVGGSEALDSIEEFDLATNTSRVVGTLPEPTLLAGVAAYQGKVFIAAGGDGNTKTWLFDPATGQFTVLAPLPSIAEGRNLIVNNDRLYLVEGWGYDNVNKVFEYNAGINAWSIVTTVPTFRNVPMVEAVDGVLYVMGGSQVDYSPGNVNEAWRFAGSWTVNSVSPGQPDSIDWLATQHEPLTAGSYLKIADTIYAVQSPIGPGSWNGSGFIGVTLAACDQATGAITGPAYLPGLEGQPLSVYNLPLVTTATPPGGTYTSTQTVALTANKPATIYFTTDGSEPTTASPVYSWPLSFDESITLRFFAVDSNGNRELAPRTEQYVINKQNQSIDFPEPPGKTYGDGPFALNATATSGLQVDYVSSNPAVAMVSGSTVTVVGAGTATITAYQGGDANFKAAASVDRQLTVGKAAAGIVLTSINPSPSTYGEAVTISATVTPATAGGVVHFSNGQGWSQSAVVAGGNAQLTTVTLPAGINAVTAQYPGNDNYLAATSSSLTQPVNKGAQSIVFPPLASKTVIDAPFVPGASASSGLPISFTSTNPAVATVSGTTITIVGLGTTTIIAGQWGDSNYNAAATVSQVLTVTKAPATVTFDTLNMVYDGTAKAVTVATTPAGLALVVTYDGAATPPTAPGSYTVVATVSDATYQGSATGTLVVGKASQIITFAELVPKTYGDPVFTLVANAGSGLPISFASSNPAVATVSGTSVTIVGAGSTTITASQEGDGNYAAAVAVSQPLTVNKGTAMITLGNLAATYTGTAKSVTATTAPAGLTVLFTYDGAAAAPTAAGSYGVTGIIDAANYQGSATGTLTIAKAATSVNVATVTPNPSSYGQAVTVTASVTPVGGSGQVQFSNGQGWVQTVAVTPATGSASITSSALPAGSNVITARYLGDSNHEASPVSSGVTQIVNKGGQTITFAAVPNKMAGDPDFTLSATASSGLAVTFSSSNTAVAQVSGNVVTIVGPGTATIIASQWGDNNFNAASAVSQTFSVISAEQGIKLNDGGSDVYFTTLAAAYDSITSGANAVIRLPILTLAEALVFDHNYQLTLMGGYDPLTDTYSGITTIQGSVTVQNGSLIIAGPVSIQ
jgi:N-acetylneuraminic acid mutarotase